MSVDLLNALHLDLYTLKKEHLKMNSEQKNGHIAHTSRQMHSQFISMQTGEQASFCQRENGECEGRDEGDKCPPGP